jgi:hypothetical protein
MFRFRKAVPEDAPPKPLGQQIVERLRKGQLPRMVDWFDPLLLAQIGMRTVVSSTLGSYADQRITQATTDRVTDQQLRERYNYSKHPEYAADAGAEGLWVDYISDLGDGFEATYAMAYLMAQDSMKVKGTEEGARPLRLEAGKILIMGGDQAYPQSSPQEYQARLIDPYDWAFTTKDPKRKLFALPGNHDWYDGLAAFDGLFCSARTARVQRKNQAGRAIGGWVCQQHRSYFAIHLPHDWWIWGTDIQLGGTFDDGQRDYFDLISETETGPGHKIIICLAEPSWLHEQYDNMHEIVMLAQKKGARVVAVLAGDWHHYSRFRCQDAEKAPLDVEFITCGGGGAFAHATHSLPETVKLAWPERTGAPDPVADARDPLEFNRAERNVVGPGEGDFTLGQHQLSAGPETVGAPLTSGVMPLLSQPIRAQKVPTSNYDCVAESIYPTRTTSRLLSLFNLLLPFHNRRFAVFVGVVYFLYAWVFTISIADYDRRAEVTKAALVEAEQSRQFIETARNHSYSADKHAEAIKEKSPGSPEATEAAEQAKAAGRTLEAALAMSKAIKERAAAFDDKKAGDESTQQRQKRRQADDDRQLGPRIRKMLKAADEFPQYADMHANGIMSHARKLKEASPPTAIPKMPPDTTCPRSSHASAADEDFAAAMSSAKDFVASYAALLRNPPKEKEEARTSSRAQQAPSRSSGGTSQDKEQAKDAKPPSKIEQASIDARACLTRAGEAAIALVGWGKSVSGAAGIPPATAKAASDLAVIAGGAADFAPNRAATFRAPDWKDAVAAVFTRITDSYRVFIASQANPAFFFMLLGLWVGLVYYADVNAKTRGGLIVKLWLGTLHFLMHMGALLLVNSVLAPFVTGGVAITGLIIALVLGLIAILLLLLFAPLLLLGLVLVLAPLALIGWLIFTMAPELLLKIFELVAGPVGMLLGIFGKLFGLLGKLYAWIEPVIWVALAPLTVFIQPDVIAVVVFALCSIAVGGFLGAMIFGVYWALTSALASMHTGDAFGALGLRHYKHFLRMRFEPDRLTIFPIAVDRIPGRRRWQAPKDYHQQPSHNPQIEPIDSLAPRLIEPPIVISASGRPVENARLEAEAAMRI